MGYGHLSSAEFKRSSQGLSQDLNDKPFGTLRDGSMGHGGIAISTSHKFEGDSADDMRFEGDASKSHSDAAQVEKSGFGA